MSADIHGWIPERITTLYFFSICYDICYLLELAKKTRTMQITERFSGVYSDGVPPLPFPNREVKPVSADGTAGNVGE